MISRVPEEPERALVFRKPYLDAILAGTKKIELRGKKHTATGPTYLLESQSGLVRAVATLGEARALTDAERA